MNSFSEKPDPVPEEISPLAAIPHPEAATPWPPATLPPTAAPSPDVPPPGILFSSPGWSSLPKDPPWSGWDVLRIVLMLIVGFVIVLVGLAFAVPGANFRSRLITLNARPELLILGQMGAYLLVLGYMYVLVTRERGQPRFWRAMRWNWPARYWIYVLLGFAMQGVFMIVERFLPFPKETPFDAVLRRPYTIVLISLFSVTLGPLMEEMFFRGFFYPVVKRRAGAVVAIVATALPFGLVHAAQYGNSWAPVFLIFVVGVVLAAVREKRDSLAASFLVHVGYNGTIILILFAATDGFRHLEKLNQ